MTILRLTGGSSSLGFSAMYVPHGNVSFAVPVLMAGLACMEQTRGRMATKALRN